MEPKEARSGARLFAAMQDAASALPQFHLEPVECLLNCNHGCNIALRSEGKWSYHFGDLDPENQVENILRLAELHHQAPDGEVPWGKRPEAIKRKAVSRIPPLPMLKSKV